jgi:hypothetical protein
MYTSVVHTRSYFTIFLYDRYQPCDSKPVKQPPRRVPIAFAEEEKKLIVQTQEQGIIRKSSSPWSSPLVSVIKKNGKVRPCVDYRGIHVVTIKDAFPLPRIQDCLDTVAGEIQTNHIW